MPSSPRRPLDERARARLRDAQRSSPTRSPACTPRRSTEMAFAPSWTAVIAKRQGAIDEADHTLSKAQAHLVSVSGIQRAALLLEQPVAALSRRTAPAEPARKAQPRPGPGRRRDVSGPSR